MKKIFASSTNHYFMVSTLAAINTTANNVPSAGTLSMQLETQFKISTRKGDVRSNPKVGTIATFKLRIGDGFGSAKSKTLKCVRQ